MRAPDECNIAEAHLLLVQLIYSRNMSVKYEHLCRKHVKIFLLNCTITKHQILQFNQFINVRIVSVNLKNNTTVALQQYVVLSATKILFICHENKDNGGMVKDTLDKHQLSKMLQSRLVVSRALLDSIADSVVSGIGDNLLSSKMKIGILIQSDIGGGKSTLLKALHETYGGVKSHRLNFKEFQGRNR
jgi:hypothetical protein